MRRHWSNPKTVYYGKPSKPKRYRGPKVKRTITFYRRSQSRTKKIDKWIEAQKKALRAVKYPKDNHDSKIKKLERQKANIERKIAEEKAAR